MLLSFAPGILSGGSRFAYLSYPGASSPTPSKGTSPSVLSAPRANCTRSLAGLYRGKARHRCWGSAHPAEAVAAHSPVLLGSRYRITSTTAESEGGTSLGQDDHRFEAADQPKGATSRRGLFGNAAACAQ